jgi:hypothetical protein
VLGATRDGYGLVDFRQYMIDLRQPEDKFFFNYNTWWTQSNHNMPIQYTQDTIFNLIDTLDSKLLSPYGVTIDSFTLDEGWANQQSIWKINLLNFPTQFDALKAKLQSKNMGLGIWISPSGWYGSINKSWAQQNNYTLKSINGGQILCHYDEPGKSSYSDEFENTLAGYVSRYGLANIKFDDFTRCRDYGAEEANRFLKIEQRIKSIKPDIKFELQMQSTAGNLVSADYLKEPSGDYPSGFLPALNGKDAYLTARDQIWIDYGSRAVPPKLMQDYGLIIQSDEDWENDAIASVMRGTGFVPLYINPQNMDKEEWAYLAGVIKWARSNQVKLLQNTSFIGGRPGSGEVYGFVHYYAQTREAYVYLRNPAIDETDYDLDLNALGFTQDDAYMAKVIYPYKYMFDGTYSLGSYPKIHLGPFETLALHIMPRSMVQNELLGVRYENTGSNILRIWPDKYAATNPRIMTNGQNPQYRILPVTACDPSSIRVSSSQVSKGVNSITGSFVIEASSNYDIRLVVSMHSPVLFNTSSITSFSFKVDGSDVPVQVKRSEDQWRAELQINHYWTYLIAPVPAGSHSVAFSVDNIPGQLDPSARIVYTETLSARNLSWNGWVSDSDDILNVFRIGEKTGSIPVGKDYSSPDKCVNNQTCAAGETGECGVCKSDGSGWVNDDSKCGDGKICSRGVCVFGCSRWDYLTSLGGVLKFPPSLAAINNRLVVTGIGLDNSLWVDEYIPGQKISTDWYSVGGILTSGTKMTFSPGGLEITALGNDGNRWSVSYVGEKNWVNWRNIGGTNLGNCGPTSAQIGNIVYRLGVLDRSWPAGSDKNVFIENCDVSRTFCTPYSVSGCRVCKSDGSAWADDSTKCSANQACQDGQCVCSSWDNVTNFGGSLKYDPSAVASGDNFIITDVGTDNAVWALEYNPVSDSSTGWYSLGGCLSTKTKITLEDSIPWVYAKGCDSPATVFKNRYLSSKAWSGWAGTSSTDLSTDDGPGIIVYNGLQYRVSKTAQGSVALEKCKSAITTTTTTTTTSTPTRITTTSSSTTSTRSTTTSTTTSSSTTTSTPITCSSTPSTYLAAGINSVVFQTPHPYYNSMDCFSGTYVCPPGYAARVNVKYDVESWYDYFYVYNSVAGNATLFSGNSSGFVWINSDYNSVRFRFTSDESIARWGVDVDLVDCYAASTTTTSSTTTLVSTTTTTLNTTSTSTTTQTTTSTTLSGPCVMKGNEPPCDLVTLAEVVDAINQWASGNLNLGQVIDLINSWAEPSSYPPQ